jgi:recombination protein RecT
MAKTDANKVLKDKLNNAPAVTAQGTVANQVHQYLERMKPEMARALPRHMTPERMARIALTCIRTNPVLLSCSIDSRCACVMEASQLGLEPGILGECHLVPYGREAKLIKGYQGLIKLVRQSGELISINADVIHANDEFSYVRGYEENLEHKPNFKDPGEVVGFYAYALLKDGGRQSTVMSKEQVDKIRARSRAKDNGPWVTDYEEMGKKTALRRLCKYLPMSVQAREAVEEDDRREFGPDPVEMNLGEVQEIKVQPPAPLPESPAVPQPEPVAEKAPSKPAKPQPSPDPLLAYELQQGQQAGWLLAELTPAQAKWLLTMDVSGQDRISAEDKEKLIEYVARFPDA